MNNFTDILFEKKDGIAQITLNRPKVMNTFRWETIEDLITAFSDVAKDKTIGAVIVTGTGKAFCCGGDIKALQGLDRDSGRQWNHKLVELAMLMRRIPQPVIAAVNGYCIGGGNELNIFCDMSIASDKAVFGQGGPKIGGCPLWGGTQLLPRIVGEKMAREMIMLCNQYPAEEAKTIGLVNRVVPHEQLIEEAENYARRVLEMAPQSIQLAKLSLNYESDALYSSLLHGGALLEFVWESEQFREGTSAFVEKRLPNFDQFRK
ncbi:1,4-dihydroxy-6-naphthoate synthase [Peribacillus cavernae]|uniref:1,4-dihydroxy-6-naphthoate synthase n=1 Tax=Peribacillus cavernae TaxID=1674310 RepID=A0A3S0TSE4_9BACI|nr:enoyl-CoA hydratase-related protein [Peribacillus cavernae]MDQ0219451.1 dihydroxynaphthoic acid synthetase [Peribacillus cavernae]RUQ27126.1 1,4-dihydroxy-6-naphthoate synthase [Peribacillus cavernae]